MDIEDKKKKIEELKQQVSLMEKELIEEKKQKLRDLPAQVGYQSLEALYAAIGELLGKKSSPVAASGKRKRLTKQEKDSLADDIRSGMTGAQAAAKYGISQPTVHNVKVQYGLVNSRS